MREKNFSSQPLVFFRNKKSCERTADIAFRFTDDECTIYFQECDDFEQYEELFPDVVLMTRDDGKMSHVKIRDSLHENPIVDYEQFSDSLYISFSDEQPYKTDHHDYQIMVDRNAQGKLIGLEILDLSHLLLCI